MPLDISRIQAVFFDVDGTLRDTDDQFVNQIAAWLKPASRLLPARDARAFSRRLVMRLEDPGNYVQGLMDRLDIDRHLARLSDTLFSLGAGRQTAARPIIPGVHDLLLALSDRYPLAIVSARGERATLGFLEEHQLQRFFRVVVAGQTCRRNKPFPDPVLFAAKQLGFPPENCLMVGDTTVDMRAGRLAGAQTVGVLCGFGEERELVYAGADLILSSTPLLLNCLLPEPETAA
jgi:phosphoglycolate phosphatase-like HAD superfamily hydrolase